MSFSGHRSPPSLDDRLLSFLYVYLIEALPCAPGVLPPSLSTTILLIDVLVADPFDNLAH